MGFVKRDLGIYGDELYMGADGKCKVIEYNNRQYAIVIPNEHKAEGVEFLTEGSYSQQLAYMSHPKGKMIDAHLHNRVVRNVEYTQEVLVIKKGKLRVDFYNDEKEYLESTVVEEGDVILLVSGGHGFKVLEDLEMIEIKQGPYLGDDDKIRFDAVDDSRIVYRDNI